jgi:hypothetical protein
MSVHNSTWPWHLWGQVVRRSAQRAKRVAAGPQGPKKGTRWPARTAGLALVVLASLVVTALASVAPASAAGSSGGTGPADLFYLPMLDATAAQQASLEDLERQAVDNTLTDHGLPASDFDAAQTWGRDAAEGELWALLIQAIQTPAAQQTADQANAVAWFTGLVQRQDVQAADDAGLEYAKWAGFGADAYQSLLASHPSQAQLQAFLSVTPEPYISGESTSTPESTSNEGYCLFVPPAPDSSDYQGNVYSGQTTPETCYEPCSSFFGCSPPTPSYNDFVSWGVADADDQAFDNPSWAAVASDVADGLGFGLASLAAVGTGAALATSSAFASLLTGTSLAATLAPFAGMDFMNGPGFLADVQASIAGVDIGGAVAIVLTAIAIGAIEAFNVISAAQVPGQLAQLVYDAPNNPPGLASMLRSSSGTTALYSSFIAATLPQPTGGASNCNNNLLIASESDPHPAPCLNAPAIPPASTSDPVFDITAKGATSSTWSSTLNWGSAAGVSNRAFVDGDWFVGTASSAAGSFASQALDIYYTNWAGTEETAWLKGNLASGYQFVTATANASSPISPTTCLGDGTCSEDNFIEYVGTDGKDYTATLGSPSSVPLTGVPPVPGCSEVACEVSSTSLSAAPQVGEVGQSVVLTAAPETCVGGSQCSAAAGTMAFVDDVDGHDTVLCPAASVSGGVARCSWTPTATGAGDVYATFSPAAGSGVAPSQGELPLLVSALSPTTTTVTTNSSAPPLGSTVVYTAAVGDAYAGGPAPTGTVNFTNASGVLCAGVALTAGRTGYSAFCPTSYSTAGPESVTATYSGDGETTASSGSATVSVPQGVTAVHITVPPVIVAGAPFPVQVDFSAAGVPASSVVGIAKVTGPGGTQCSSPVMGGPASCQLTVANAGPATMTASFSPLGIAGQAALNADAASDTATLTVMSSTVTVSVSGRWLYGHTPNLIFNLVAPAAVGIAGRVTCALVDGGVALDSSLAGGSHTVDGSSCSGLSLTGQYAGEFSLSYSGAANGVDVTPVSLLISLPQAEMTYGGPVPALTPAYEGFVAGDTPASLTQAPLCTTAASSTSPVGNDYKSTCSGAVDPSYAISYQDGIVHVAPADLIVTAPSPSTAYGAAVPAITPSYQGFVAGDTAASLAKAPTCQTPAHVNYPAGTYPTTCFGAQDGNYQITYQAGRLTVNPAPLQVTASSASMPEGGPVPAITPSYQGFIAGDTASSLQAAPQCSTSATSSSPPGEYPSSCSGAVDANYGISYTDGTVTVTAPASPATSG